jgi:hypothetical protein
VETFLQKFGNKIKGVLTGFDRLVFKGLLRPIMFTAGVEAFLAARGVLNKDYKPWMLAQSETLVETVDQWAQATCRQGIIPIPSSHTRKEELAHARQQATGITQGLLGVWSCVEAGSSFRATFDRDRGFPRLQTYATRCKHLYFYYDHPTYGFMSVRLQTWFPFHLQIALNGREWLGRALDAAGCAYLKHGNKFLHLDDVPLAQQLLDAQLDTRWEALLTGLLPEVFPTMRQTLGDGLRYYWTVWQSEWATDFLCDSPATVAPFMDALLRHALLTGTGARVLRYLGRPVRADDQPHALTAPEVVTRVQTWQDGARIRHWADDNSVKLYNEQNVLRVEMTLNRPDRFTVFRHQEGQREAPKQRLPLRKGIADLPLRAQVAQDVNQRFTAQLATLRDTTPVREVWQALGPRRTPDGRRARALDPLVKDRALLQAIADPALGVAGITNKALQRTLGDTPWANGKTGKALSARITRHFRLLRDHGIIRKLPKQRKYQLTEKGRQLTTLVSVVWGASTQQLLELAA